MLIPDALANTGFEPTAVIAVPVFVWRNAQMMNAKSAKNRISPNEIDNEPIRSESVSLSTW